MNPKTSFILTSIALFRTVLSQVSNPQTISLSVTYRDFLPLDCLLNFAGDGEETVEAVWGKQASSLSGFEDVFPDQACDNVTANSSLHFALLAGTVSGHADFEIAGLGTEQDECDDIISPDAGFNFPIQTCIFKGDGDAADGVEEDISRSIVSRELVVGDNGLPKMVYCVSDESDDFNECSLVGENKESKTQSSKGFFDLWYADNVVYNRRVGDAIVLDLTDEDNGLYSFNSSSAFFPLEALKDAVDSEADPLDMPVWPRTVDDVYPNGFWFTTELHTTFEFSEDLEMTFTFSGDDDFWTFVNGKMVLDISGIHEQKTGTIDLKRTSDDFSVQEFLGLEDGNVYTLDIFHADRQRRDSNFNMETTLIAACGIQLSGASAFDTFISGSDNDLDSVFSYDGVTVDGNSFVLQSGDIFSSSFLFTTGQENVAVGFDASFNFTLDGKSEGFAFVVQSEGVVDYSKSTGNTLNIGGLSNSVAVVFDLCADDDECETEEVRIHFPDEADSDNDAKSTETKRVFESFMLSIKDGSTHSARVVYFGGKPDFLEVYVDESLYLRQSDFDITEVIGSGGAHVGFTSSNSNKDGTITISDFDLKTVQVDPIQTVFDDSSLPFDVLQSIVADGEETSDGFTIQTFDLCADQLLSGTLEDLVSAKYIEKVNETSGLYFNDSTTPQVEDAEIIDNLDGTYTLQLKTFTAAEFSLAMAFGEDCEVLITLSDDEVQIPTASLDGDEESCSFQTLNDGASVVVAVANIEDNSVSTGGDDRAISQQILYVLIACGCFLLFVFVVSMVALQKYKTKWVKNKAYVGAGNEYRLDLATNYDNNSEYQSAGKRLVDSQKKILELQTAAVPPVLNGELSELRVQNDTLKTIVQQQREVNTRDSNNPNAKRDFGSIGTKTRKLNKVDF